ncbi:MAG: hypothetical protein ACRD8O_14940 [Bryobacteraceae bacterium]
MKTYTVIYAEDVPHYGHAEVEAADDDAAIERAVNRREDYHDLYDPDFHNPVCRRIVTITDQAGNTVAEDISLDSYRLECGTPQEILIRDHAKDLLEALERAFNLLEGIADKLLYDEGQPVTFLESREIEDIYDDAILELAPFETLIRKARGQA